MPPGIGIFYATASTHLTPVLPALLAGAATGLSAYFLVQGLRQGFSWNWLGQAVIYIYFAGLIPAIFTWPWTPHGHLSIPLPQIHLQVKGTVIVGDLIAHDGGYWQLFTEKGNLTQLFAARDADSTNIYLMPVAVIPTPKAYSTAVTPTPKAHSTAVTPTP